MLGAILDVLLGRNWFVNVDKEKLCEICVVKKIKIEENEELSGAFNYVDAETGNMLFIATRYNAKAGKALKEHISKEMSITQSNIMPGADSLYYETGDKQKNVLVIRKNAIDLLTIKLSKSQLIQVAQHFADKKIM